MMFFTFGRKRCTANTGARSRAGWLAGAALVATFDAAAVGLGGGMPLYDAAATVLPDQAPWQWIYGGTGAPSSVGMTPSATFLDSTASSGVSGYSRFLDAGMLNSVPGFSLDFSLRIAAESHANDNRSGYSMIVLDHAARGVELSFWSDQVWAKNADAAFSHGESIDVDTRTVERSYRLTFSGGNYSLTTDGVLPLTGALRDYLPEAEKLGPLPAFVYSRSNYIFLGDNTGSASASFELSMINLAPVPEPAEWAMMLAGLACVGAAARLRRRRGAEACPHG